MQTMRCDERELAFHEIEHAPLQLVFRFNVKMSSRLIEQQNIALGVQTRTSERDTLGLASRKTTCPISDARRQPFRQILDQRFEIHIAYGAHDLFIDGVRTVKRDVFAQRRMKQVRVLGDEGDAVEPSAAPQRR